jgi:hypothetical protein
MRPALLKHVDRIEMVAEGKSYLAKGNWKLLGEVRPRDGAGGPDSTLGPTLEFRFELAA